MALFCCEVRECRVVTACLSSNCSKEIYLALRWCVYSTVDHMNWANLAVLCQPTAKRSTCLLVCRSNHLIFFSSHFQGNQHLFRKPLFQIHRNASSVAIKGYETAPPPIRSARRERWNRSLILHYRFQEFQLSDVDDLSAQEAHIPLRLHTEREDSEAFPLLSPSEPPTSVVRKKKLPYPESDPLLKVKQPDVFPPGTPQTELQQRCRVRKSPILSLSDRRQIRAVERKELTGQSNYTLSK